MRKIYSKADYSDSAFCINYSKLPCGDPTLHKAEECAWCPGFTDSC